jgi:hypothetical protein
MRPIVVRTALLLLVGVIAWAGCGDALSLLPAVYENRVDTVTLWAASRTAITLPSGYAISQRSRVRLDQASSFDFLYDLTPDGERIFVPLAALVNTGRLTGNPGFRFANEDFDAITLAPQDNYVANDTVRPRLGDVYFVRSGIESSCALGIPYYAKLQLIGIDDSARAVSFQILTNINCGYRGLQIGLPKK